MIKKIIFLCALISILSVPTINAQEISHIEVTTIKQFQTVAPGSSLPISLKLLNMGGTGRIDVQLTYWIEDKNQNIISKQSETVAVETSASFVKQILIPTDLKRGQYFLFADLQYPDQKEPARTSLPFKIDYKYFGFFLNQILILVGLIIASIISAIFIIRYFSHKNKTILSEFDYDNAPKGMKPYYELVSDQILTMRLHIGDKAIKIANKIEGVKISDQGEVIELTKEPMEVVALLTLQYEKEMGYNGKKLAEKTIKSRAKKSVSLEDQLEYEKTKRLLNNINKYFQPTKKSIK